MAAYVIIDARVTDDAPFRANLDQVPAIVKAHGGKYLVRGGRAIFLSESEAVHDSSRRGSGSLLEFASSAW